MKKGKIIILSAPSGCGKSTIIAEVIKDTALKLEFSISATNREPRRGETDGVNYYFLSTEDFKKAIESDSLVEYEEVYPGRFYGTLKSEIARICADGNNAILDIDVKGALNVKKLCATVCCRAAPKLSMLSINELARPNMKSRLRLNSTAPW